MLVCQLTKMKKTAVIYIDCMLVRTPAYIIKINAWVEKIESVFQRVTNGKNSFDPLMPK